MLNQHDVAVIDQDLPGVEHYSLRDFPERVRKFHWIGDPLGQLWNNGKVRDGNSG